MKKRIALLESDGYEEECWCRRERVAGRLELLTAFFDGSPFWFVRLRGRTQADADYLRQAIGLEWFGNGHWRFVQQADAEKKFVELLSLPKYAAEAEAAAARRARNRQAFLAKVSPVS